MNSYQEKLLLSVVIMVAILLALTVGFGTNITMMLKNKDDDESTDSSSSSEIAAFGKNRRRRECVDQKCHSMQYPYYKVDDSKEYCCSNGSQNAVCVSA